MKLSRLFACLLTICLFFIFALPALADCDINSCMRRETFKQGSCPTGTVLNCDSTGTIIRKECASSTAWTETSKEITGNDACTITYIAYTLPSLQKFQQQLKNCATTGETTQECFIGGAATPDDPEKSSSGIMENVENTITTHIVGYLPMITVGSSPESMNNTYISGGAIGSISNLIAVMYANPPASSVEYLADLSKNLGIVKPVYAQDTGFESLRPILPIWKAFRSLAYFFFSLVFVVIGFAIMFRLKLNPQTVISIQNAIPRIIMALILVTFSYAIAGLLIDLANVASSIIVAVINPSYLPEWLNTITDFINKILPGTPIKTMMPSNPNIAEFLLLYMGKGAEYASYLSRLLNPVTAVAEMANVPNLITQILQVLTALTPLGMNSSLITLILAVILLLAFFKLFLSLLKAYVLVIISVILGPLQIMLGALPGQNGFGGWMRNLIANLAVFPAVIIMMALTMKIVEVSEGGPLWIPSPLRPPELGPVQLGGFSGRIVTAMIAYGMLLLMPKVVDMVKEAFKVKPFAYGSAIGEAFGPVRKGAVTAGRGGISAGAGWLEARGSKVPANIIRTIFGVK